MNKLFTVILSIVIMIFFFWFAYWVAKHFSYWLFYEDMVIQTIKELVKPDSLR